MLNFFKKRKNNKSKKSSPILLDLDNNPIQVGDKIMSLRYEMGECLIIQSENGIEYESVENGTKVSWLKMIDASTDKQKVRKILPEN